MTFEEFDKFQKDLLSEVEYMKTTKGKEYANSITDRFANFNRLANDLGLKNYQVGWVYTKKHLDAIAQYCRTQETQSTESIRGRFVDAICYLTLMAGMVEESQRPHQSFAKDYQDIQQGVTEACLRPVLDTGLLPPQKKRFGD